MGWKAFGELSPKGKSLVRALEENPVVDIKPGELGTKHMAELTRYFKGEVGVLQGPKGDLKLVLGEETRTTIPADLREQGYKFAVHTHPEDRIPGELTEMDRLRGLRNSMEKDLEMRRNSGDTHIEAVVNRRGDVTYFDHTGILSAPNGPLPGGPINPLGFIVPVRGL